MTVWTFCVERGLLKHSYLAKTSLTLEGWRPSHRARSQYDKRNAQALTQTWALQIQLCIVPQIKEIKHEVGIVLDPLTANLARLWQA